MKTKNILLALCACCTILFTTHAKDYPVKTDNAILKGIMKAAGSDANIMGGLASNENLEESGYVFTNTFIDFEPGTDNQLVRITDFSFDDGISQSWRFFAEKMRVFYDARHES